MAQAVATEVRPRATAHIRHSDSTAMGRAHPRAPTSDAEPPAQGVWTIHTGELPVRVLAFGEHCPLGARASEIGRNVRES